MYRWKSEGEDGGKGGATGVKGQEGKMLENVAPPKSARKLVANYLKP